MLHRTLLLGLCAAAFGKALLLGASPALAQSPVVTNPGQVGSVNASSTITTTNTFQSVFAQATGAVRRNGCTLQNNGSNNQWVFFGALASATTPKSVKMAPGTNVLCANGAGGTLQDQVSITGTAGEEFFANRQ